MLTHRIFDRHFHAKFEKFTYCEKVIFIIHFESPETIFLFGD
jgi:hypothetical protein